MPKEGQPLSASKPVFRQVVDIPNDWGINRNAPLSTLPNSGASNALNGLPKGYTSGLSPNSGVPNAYSGVPSSPSDVIRPNNSSSAIVKFGASPPSSSPSSGGSVLEGAGGTASRIPISGLGKGLGIAGALLVLPQTASDFGAALGQLYTLPQQVQNQNEANRLAQVVRGNEAIAQLALERRIDNAVAPALREVPQGLSDGVVYQIKFYYDDKNRGGNPPTKFITVTAVGPIVCPVYQNGGIGFTTRGAFRYLVGSEYYTFNRYEVRRQDGQPETDNTPPEPSPNGSTPIPPIAGDIIGSPTIKIGGNAAKMLDAIDAANANFPKITPIDNASSPSPKLDPLQPKQSPSSANQPLNKVENPTPASFTASPSFQKVNPTDPQYANRNSVTPTEKDKKVATPITTQPPVNPNQTAVDLTDISLKIIGLGLGLGAALTGIDYLKNLNNQINQQTSNANQQTNAKQGVCDAMQPNQCGFEGVKQATTEATNPIKDIANSNNGLLTALNTALTAFIAFCQTTFGTILNLLNNQAIDRAVNMLNLAVNITNLLMLTESAGKALGSIADAVFALTPLQFTNDKGQKTTASTVFGQNASALVVNIIGSDNYASLKENLAVGNRIIKSSTNLLNQTSKILYQQSKQQQKTGVEVSNIANALIDNGVVNQNSYPKAANSPEANAAMTTDDTNIIQGKLGVIKQGIAGLKKITQTINSNVRLVKGIQKSFKGISDLVDGESKARKTIRNTAKTEAVRKAKFSSIQIKQIKAK
jgi:hypothetical protein